MSSHCHPDRSNCSTIMLSYHWATQTAGTLRTWPLQDFATKEPTGRGTEWTGWPSSGFAIWMRTKKCCYPSTGWQIISSNWKSREQTLWDDRCPLAEVCHVATVVCFCSQKSGRRICWIFATWGWYHKSITSSTNLTQWQVHCKLLAWDGHKKWKCDWYRRWVGRWRRHKTMPSSYQCWILAQHFPPWRVCVCARACVWDGGGGHNVCYDIFRNAIGKNILFSCQYEMNSLIMSVSLC